MSTRPWQVSRRNLLKAGGVTALAASVWGYRKIFPAPKYPFSGQLMGANSKVGHLLRTGVTAKPTRTEHLNTVIVGGGISGLSAAWWLQKNQHKDFILFEMDSDVGGNSTSGENAISKYPWGAHYVPLPSLEAQHVQEFFSEVGIIKGHENGLPVYDEYFLCADAQERLFFQGQWQDGLVPQHGISGADRQQYDEFFAFVEGLKNKKGQDGKRLFSIPLELSSRDPEYLKLDEISMADFMQSRGWNSKYLNWYINYCCRDDYGMPHSQVSAWAGLHYFSSRAGVAANANSQAIVTWPEGNGFLVQKLKERVGSYVKKNSLVYSIETNETGAAVHVYNPEDQSCVRYIARHVIYCGPRFTASKVIKDYESPVSLDYAPWAIANISLTQKPVSTGAPLSWDNVSYYSKSLGYIVATHQDLNFNHKETVLTYYLPLDDKSPKEERLAAYQKTYQDWLDVIIPDMEKMHPGISKTISNVDVWIWGHGMVSPGIGYLWSDKRQEVLKPFGSVHFAHSDMSGISLFEEAQYRGVEAAKAVLNRGRS